MREIIRKASGETLDLKAYEADMRHLIDTYIEADESRKISPFDNISLLDLIVKSGIATAIQGALTPFRRVIEILDTNPTIRDVPTARALERSNGIVRFENVWFGYDPNRPVLKGIDFEGQPGQLVAFVCNWRVAIMTDCPDEILRTEFDPAAFAQGVRDIVPPTA